MGAHDIFRILAVILAFATVAIATKRVKNGWMPWAAIPVVAVVWYLALAALFMAYYMWNIRGVR